VPEIRRLQTCTVQKGRSPPKEAVATRRYEEGGPGSYAPFCTTGRGVHLRGEVKGLEARSRRETDGPQR
jgi:hypothetical protein